MLAEKISKVQTSTARIGGNDYVSRIKLQRQHASSQLFSSSVDHHEAGKSGSASASNVSKSSLAQSQLHFYIDQNVAIHSRDHVKQHRIYSLCPILRLNATILPRIHHPCHHLRAIPPSHIQLLQSKAHNRTRLPIPTNASPPYNTLPTSPQILLQRFPRPSLLPSN